jgi:glyoxylase-like metal-dependent hydrolase (beta-lactamase superfamily II)
MDVHELAPGMRYWFAPHPAWNPQENWPEGVLCAYYEGLDALVLFDPLVPRGEEDEFWRALDEDVERHGLPVRVLLTTSWHDRDTRLVVERYDADVWAHPDATWKDETLEEHLELLRPVLTRTDELPAGVEAFIPDGNEEGQVAYFLREHGTLVTGDMFSGTGGRFHVFISPDEPNPEAFLASLPALLELPIERVLIAHGEPVLSDGVARIREALESA